MTRRLTPMLLAFFLLGSLSSPISAVGVIAPEGPSSPLVGEGCTDDEPTRGKVILPALWPCGVRIAPDGAPEVVPVAGEIAGERRGAEAAEGWTHLVRPSPTRRTNSAMAYLPALEGVVMFGGLVCPGWVCNPVAETWLWNGSEWDRLSPTTSPPPLHAAAMTYDPARQELVLFGGETCTEDDCFFSSETWTFDGTTWERQNTAVSPIASAASAMAFDPTSSRVILSGGCAQERCPGLVGTWSWDGTTWELEDLLTPLPRAGASMATNPDGGVVLFGGADLRGSTSAETWIWDGEWAQHGPDTSPPPRAYGAATYHAGRDEVVLFAGNSVTCSLGCSGGYVKDTWTWDGQSWTERPSDPEPRVGQSHAIAYDAAREEVVRFGGIASFTNHIGAPTAAYESSTWLWDGATWSERRSPMPEERIQAAMGFHAGAGVLVLAGGYCVYSATCDTWTFDGIRWMNIGLPAPRPNARNSLLPGPNGSLLFPTADAVWSLDYDDDEQRWSWSEAPDSAAPSPGGWATAGDRDGDVVLFGAQDCCPSAYWDRTWTWSAGAWHEEAPATRPPARAFQAMTYRPESRDTVMFGGLAAGGQTYFADTWLWDGAAWRSGPAGPPSRAFTRVAADPATGDVMLYGGVGGGTTHPVLGDQWMFDGETWREIASPPPGLRLEHSLADFPAHSSTVLFGGQDANPGRPMSETWIWSGNG